MSDVVRFEALLAGLKDGLPTTLEQLVLLWLERLAEQDAGAPDWLHEHAPIAEGAAGQLLQANLRLRQLISATGIWFTPGA
ncbi:MAG: hypothetical protein U5K38_07935 [Woeseiaceae bacterium]|nr:hypothetical protein [Woeseiaceae bacterium]